MITGKKFTLSCAAMSVQVLACQKMNSPEAQGRTKVQPPPVRDAGLMSLFRQPNGTAVCVSSGDTDCRQFVHIQALAIDLSMATAVQQCDADDDPRLWTEEADQVWHRGHQQYAHHAKHRCRNKHPAQGGGLTQDCQGRKGRRQTEEQHTANRCFG